MMRQRRGRRRCRRWVENIPAISQFEPIDAVHDRGEVNILIEEFEAVRLVDFLNLNQVEAAVQMGVSQKTLWNDLSSARKKIADAIVNGKTIKIKGGSYALYRKTDESAGK